MQDRSHRLSRLFRSALLQLFTVAELNAMAGVFCHSKGNSFGVLATRFHFGHLTIRRRSHQTDCDIR